jgi:hypothetical protein
MVGLICSIYVLGFGFWTLAMDCDARVESSASELVPVERITGKIFFLSAHSEKGYPFLRFIDECGHEQTQRLSDREFKKLYGRGEVLKWLKEFLYTQANLQVFPQHIVRVTTLEVLDLSDNQLSELPASMGQLVNLRRLNLAHNNFKTVPVVLGKLMRLSHLDIQKNQLSEIPVAALVWLARLTEVDLSDNPVLHKTEIKAKKYEGQAAIQELCRWCNDREKKKLKKVDAGGDE